MRENRRVKEPIVAITKALTEGKSLEKALDLLPIDKIIKKIPQKPQIEVYSATISNKVRDFLRKYISPDFILTVNEEHNTSSTVNHHFINTKHNDRYQLILDFIKIKNPYFLLVFASSKDEVTKIYNFLSSNNINSGIISGALEARERKNMLRRIKNNEFQVVVCSDLAARGLDIENVTDVLNFDLFTEEAITV